MLPSPSPIYVRYCLRTYVIVKTTLHVMTSVAKVKAVVVIDFFRIFSKTLHLLPSNFQKPSGRLGYLRTTFVGHCLSPQRYRRINTTHTKHTQDVNTDWQILDRFGHQSGLYESSRRNSTKCLHEIVCGVCSVFSKIWVIIRYTWNTMLLLANDLVGKDTSAKQTQKDCGKP